MTIISGLAEGQVLQRLGAKGANAVVRGTSAADRSVHATITKGTSPVKGWSRRTVGTASRGKFEIELDSIPTGGPYRLTLECGAEKFEVKSFYVGDVWIMAGQSNMQGVGNMTGKAAPHPLIRNFSMRREWRLAEDPLNMMSESPDAFHTPKQVSVREGERLRRTTVKGVSPGLFFARDMLRRSGGVPQGLIATAHGGTSMSQWDPALKKLKGESLYWSMLESVRQTGQPVAGMLWYQGESDASPDGASKYVARMKKLVAASRRDIGQPRLPWIIVQIGRFFRDGVNIEGWNSIRELQRSLPEKIQNLETAPTIDLPLDDGIHIGSAGFPQLGLRMACIADRLVYGNTSESLPPKLRGVRMVERETRPAPIGIEVTFDNVEGGLRSGSEPSGFLIQLPDGSPANLIFKTTLHGNKVRLHIDQRLGMGVNLYYGYGVTPVCNVTDARGFSLPAFGPYSLGDHKPKAFQPYVTKWSTTALVPPGKKLDRYTHKEVTKIPATVKDYAQGAIVGGMVNEHPQWEGNSGLCFFRTSMHLPEAMKLDVLMGYDGPFRLWIDGKPFFANMAGINPCYIDESSKTVEFKAGKHDLTVGMDVNGGKAWGFFLRFARRDITKAQVASGTYAKPVYA